MFDYISHTHTGTLFYYGCSSRCGFLNYIFIILIIIFFLIIFFAMFLIINILFELVIHYNGLFKIQFHTVDCLISYFSCYFLVFHMNLWIIHLSQQQCIFSNCQPNILRCIHDRLNYMLHTCDCLLSFYFSTFCQNSYTRT